MRLPGNETVPAVIIFGDSIVETGNNNDLRTPAKCNFPPYGRDFQGGIPTGRFSNGKVPSDLIVKELGIKDLVPSYKDPNLKPNDLLTGVSFASGGSGYDPLTPKLLSVISLPDQLKQFKEYIGKLKANFGEDRTNFILTRSIILVVASSNDIANSYFASGIRKAQYDISSYTDFILGYASSFIKELYGLGARRVGVFGAPPLGCVPSQRTLFGGIGRVCSQQVNQASMMFNAKLSAELHSLKQHMPQARIVYFDVYNPLLHIIQNPATYGFQVVDKGCCGTGTLEVSISCNRLEPQTCTDESNYMFWDSYHPTERTYKILVGKVLNKYISSFF
ncbi:hypothetical protein L6164_024887 [Bauhinia variegata]|uniref:Uncharacterized protein n=1 Tax=Bauhinia variegata TaxID=167791 RepID=A0ACB9M0C5_BAUVA|nr:hypothetical protein L6164_024887 [Bauhinia variegata]